MIGNVIGKIRAALGGRLMICMRLGCFDSVPYFRAASGIGVACDYPAPYPYGFGVDANVAEIVWFACTFENA